MSRFRLYAVRVFTRDWQRALAFYRDTVGFPLEFSDDDMGWAQFKLGPAYIGLERCNPEDPEAAELVGRFVGTSIEVDDIHGEYARLRDAGVEFTSPPTEQPWGGVLAHFRDPDGNVLTLLGASAP